ncbi:hypothetical protein ACQPXB_44185 [Amycolatopsis sp. CA-161197]|uniref:hypothetical protein n=1 Tax=Amycolatopsis sp. CA-161197 TaxID=3239922 RepID=UPI003D8A3D56
MISSVANRIPDLTAHLVYLEAMVPEDGETAIDVQPMTQQLIARRELADPAAVRAARAVRSPRRD